MICKKCGSEIAENSKFCYYCGERTSLTASTAQNVGGLRMSGNLRRNPAGSFDAKRTAVPYSGQAPQSVFPEASAPAKTTAEMSLPAHKKSKKKWIVLSAIAGTVLIAVLLTVVLLNGALVPTGSHSYRYFGTIGELLKKEPKIVSRIYREELTITCDDYEICEYGGMDDSITNTTHYASGLTEPYDRFMRVELLITKKSDGWRFFFEDYTDAPRWIRNVS